MSFADGIDVCGDDEAGDVANSMVLAVSMVLFMPMTLMQMQLVS